MYRLIVSDMDGTLLNSIGEIPRENLEAVKKAVSMGIEFAIVTGRPYVSVKGLLEDSGLTCSVIGCNGAQVTDEKGKLIKTHYIDRDSLQRVMKKAEEKGLYYQIYDDRYIYTKSRIRMLKMLKNYSGKSIKKHITLGRILGGIKRLFFAEVKVTGDLIRFAEKRETGFYKLQIASLKQGELDAMRRELRDIPGIDVTSSNYFNIEIGPKGINKGTALEELSKAKNISREEIMAFGDNFNDMPMLQYAGMGVAMDNGEDEVKSAAKYTTASNDNDGVAAAIKKFIFDGEK